MKVAIALLLVACNFPKPGEIGQPDAASDASTDADVDAGVPCPNCQLLSAQPAIARAGDTIVLDGTFEDGAFVTFPGGIEVAATLLDAHRATAVVPAGATAGDLSVTVGATTVGPVFFRRTSFATTIGKFQDLDDQSSGGRQMPVTAVPRWQACAVTRGNTLSIVGGGTAVIEQATIGPDGRIGAFTEAATALADELGGPCVVAGSFVYIVGGVIGTPLDTIQRAPILADGTLGTFEITDVRLSRARYNHTVALAGNVIYAAGGSTNGNPLFLANVEAVRINVDGSLTALGDVGQLSSPREALMSTVVGSSLYVFGGDATAGGAPALGLVERAQIGADGVLGAFQSSGTLAVPRQGAMTWRVGRTLFVAGGDGNGGAPTSLESSTIGPDDTLGPFTLISATALPRTLQGAAPSVIGNHAYLITGRLGTTTTVLPTLIRAPIDASGSLAGPTSTASKLGIPRDRFRTVVIGGFVYAIGGMSNNVAQRSVERAPIAPDGSIGDFETVAGGSLVVARDEPGIAIVGPFLYVFGGSQTGSGPFLRSVERARILPDGSLGAFVTVPGVTLVTARNSFATAVVGNTLVVIGGFNGGQPLASIETAAIAADGTLGAFATSTKTLVAGRNAHQVVVTSNSIFVIGGTAGSSVERATIGSDGTLGTFATQANGLNVARHSFTTLIVGSTVFAVGGFGANPLASIERASVAADGSLGVWTTSPVALSSARWGLAGVVAGNVAHLLGGIAGVNPAISATTQDMAILE